MPSSNKTPRIIFPEGKTGWALLAYARDKGMTFKELLAEMEKINRMKAHQFRSALGFPSRTTFMDLQNPEKVEADKASRMAQALGQRIMNR